MLRFALYPYALFKRVVRKYSPTSLAIMQDEVLSHSTPISTGEAFTYIRNLKKFHYLFTFFLVTRYGNLWIRQNLILSALYSIVNDDKRKPCYIQALRYLSLTCKQEYIEGYSYFLYVISAYQFYAKICGTSPTINNLIKTQNTVFSRLASSTGILAVYEMANTIDSTAVDGLAHYKNYSTFKSKNVFLLVNHDMDTFTFRKNLHRDFMYSAYFLMIDDMWAGGAVPVLYPGYSNKVFNSDKYNSLKTIFSKEYLWRFIPSFLLPDLKVDYNSSSFSVSIGNKTRLFEFLENTLKVTDSRKGKVTGFKEYNFE